MSTLQPARDLRRREPGAGRRSRGGEGAHEAEPDWRYDWRLGGRRLWRPSRRRMFRVAVLALGDAAAAGTALALALLVTAPGAALGSWVHLLPVTLVLVLAGQGAADTYGAGRARRRYGRSALAGVLAVGVLVLLAAAYPAFRLPAGGDGAVGSLALGYLLLAAAVGGLTALMRAGSDALLRRFRARGLLRRPTLAVGATLGDDRVARWLEDRDYPDLAVVDVFAFGEGGDAGEDRTVPLPRLAERLETSRSRVVLVPRDLGEREFRAVAYHCFLFGAELRVVPVSGQEPPFVVVDRDEDGMTRVELAVPRLEPVERMTKRALDVLLSGVGLLALAPLFAAVAVAVRLDTKGPVFFRQERLGRGGRRFELLKFRSMRQDAEAWLRADEELYERYVENDYKLPIDEDPRITRVGRLLRRSSLDELPQLLNVLMGEMSLVGPRPVVPPEIEEYGRYAPMLLGVRPGVTGHWQVAGGDGASYPERVRRELEYVERWSLWLDLAILVRTVPVVVRKIGVG